MNELVFPTVMGVRVSVDQDGDICIEQFGMEGEEDQSIIVPPEKAERLANAILKAASSSMESRKNA